MSINRVSISGNLTRDAELKSTQGGSSVLTFGVAVNDRRKNQQTGEWEDVPNFVDVTMFGNRASALSMYLLKGTKVAVDGRLRFSSWEKDGQRRTKLEVIAEEIEFLSARPQGQQYAAPQQQYTPPVQQYAAPTAQMPQAPAYQQAQQTFYPNQAPLPQAQPQSGLYETDIPF